MTVNRKAKTKIRWLGDISSSYHCSYVGSLLWSWPHEPTYHTTTGGPRNTDHAAEDRHNEATHLKKRERRQTETHTTLRSCPISSKVWNSCVGHNWFRFLISRFAIKNYFQFPAVYSCKGCNFCEKSLPDFNSHWSCVWSLKKSPRKRHRCRLKKNLLPRYHCREEISSLVAAPQVLAAATYVLQAPLQQQHWK